MAKKLDCEYRNAAPMLEWPGNKWALVVRVKIFENAAVRFNELSSKHAVCIRESAFACSQAIDYRQHNPSRKFPRVPLRTEYLVTKFGPDASASWRGSAPLGRENFEQIIDKRQKHY